MTESILVKEYGPPVPISLSERQREQLLNTGAEWKKTLGLSEHPLVIEQTELTFTLRARQVAGVLRVGDIHIEIAPKFLDPEAASSGRWRQAFWQILIRAGHQRTHFDRAFGSETAALSIADLLADVFLKSYARGSRRGLPLQYVEQRETSSRPQGSFDHSRLSQWIVAPWNVPSVTDVLSPNTPLARLLSWAANQLKSLVQSAPNARSLMEIRQELAGSGNTPNLMEAERLNVGVQHDALQPALDVAILLLRGHGLNHGHGENDVIGFLWKTADVYEQFLYWLCQSAAKRLHLRVSKTSATFAVSQTENPLRTTPDIGFSNANGESYAVLDAKYKNLNSAPKAEDSYQILTAAHTLGCRSVGLVYPISGWSPVRTWTAKSQLGGDSISMSALFIDPCLAADERGISALETSIAHWLANVPESLGS